MTSLTASVGRGGVNRGADVQAVQELLNRWLEEAAAGALLEVDGVVGEQTIASIVEFQRQVVKLVSPDGRVDPGGRTWTRLSEHRPPSAHEDGEAGLTMHQFVAIMRGLPQEKARIYLGPLNAAMQEGEINTPLRMAAFLAQLGHESCDLKYFEELASGDAYEGRADLGNTHAGDGRRYKGRGPIQLTGRTNYRAAGKALSVDLEGQPELAATPEYGFRIAVWYWTTRKLNEKADAQQFDAITKSINGGYNGKNDRDARYAKAKEVLGVAVA